MGKKNTKAMMLALAVAGALSASLLVEGVGAQELSVEDISIEELYPEQAPGMDIESIQDGIPIVGENVPVVVTLPSSWEGKVLSEEAEGNEVHILRFLHKASKETGHGGHLFSLFTYQDYSFVNLPSYRPVGVLSKGDVRYYLVALMPTDVQYGLEERDEYQSLSDRDTLQKIFDGVRPREGWTLESMDPDELYEQQALARYKTELRISLAFNKMPDREEMVPKGWEAEMDSNHFAICDVNEDGRIELLITVEDAPMYAKRTEVYHLGEGLLKRELGAFPGVVFYEQGVAKTFASHNHTYGLIWPYSVYRYDPQIGQYKHLGAVYSWNRTVNETFGETPFPEAADEDGNGVVYHIEEETRSEWVDDQAYDDWVDQMFGSLEELTIPWQPLTHEAIDLLE